MKNETPRTIHGIDLTAPGGVDALLAFHRARFGDATMHAGEGAAGGAPQGGQGAPQGTPQGTPQGGEGGQGAAPRENETADGQGERHDENGRENAREGRRGGNVWDDPESARSEIERLRKENARDRTAAKENAAQEARESLVKEFGKILGYEADGENGQAPDVDRLRGDLEAREAEAREARLALSVFRAASDPDLGANANALLDSRAFLDSVKDLDPTDGDAVKAAIRDTVEKNPHLGATTRPTPPAGRSGGEVPGGQGATRPRATNLSEALANRYGTN